MRRLSLLERKNLWALFLFSLVFLSLQTSVFADDIDEVRDLLKEGYYVPLSEKVLNKATIDEIFEELDPYTVYFTKEEFEELIKEIDMNYVGIGIIGEEHEDGVKVVHLFESGAAIHTDLQLDDIIIEVNGTSLKGKTIVEAQKLLVGEPGTKAHLKVYRPSTKKTFTIDVIRKETEIAPTVESAWLGGDIGYLRLNSFNKESVSELKKAMKSVGQVKGWIFDIRDNGGGYLDAAQDVAGLFPGVEIALIVRGQDLGTKLVLANKQNPQLTKPIIMLVNSDSASASEILAGAVQDEGAARLYGQTTYGKGLAQAVFELSSGNYVKMTVAEFFTPRGNVIEGVGIIPDVETEIGEELAIAHRDLLLMEEDFVELSGEKFQKKVPRNVSIGIRLDGIFSVQALGEKISLIELGGKNVAIDVVPTAFDQFMIKPKNLLDANSRYLLMIDSGAQDYVIEFETSDKIEKEEKEVNFADIKIGDFFAGPAIVLHNEGLLKGIGQNQFGPYAGVTREQAAVFFARILDLHTDEVEDPGFKDVQPGSYYYSSVAAVKKLGIMQGKSKDRFGTGDVLTRGEMAALLVRAFQLENVKNGNGGEAVLPFVDVKKSAFYNDILKIYQAGLASGTTKTTFSPEKTVTRGEFVTFLYRTIVKEKGGTEFAVLSVE
ncbi:S41 family peptidase [Calidifontibacillus erzurumensis]|uniref:S-layer homology domain-containing protein n=1 Tax=Calidifontibacillus erzurumensis TaxID=2741433 RepID=A0A8J8GGJ3_9BACI|nr:S41 family peptidase [Calidifontibacillus erzurumensis]NSL53252.1 S-layer homology domain-containing protein [Calidifontibacillus erzurumensis]